MATKFTVDRQQFSSEIDRRTNTPYVRSIHPYDETEYHWALRSPTTGRWLVRRSGTGITILPARLTEEQVAQELLNLDRQAHLTRRGGIW